MLHFQNFELFGPPLSTVSNEAKVNMNSLRRVVNSQTKKT